MPVIDDYKTTAMFTPVIDTPPAPAPEVSSRDVLKAGFAMENSVPAAIDLMGQKKWEHLPNYDLNAEAKKRNVDPALFTDTYNPDQLDYEIKRKSVEDRNNQILDENGWLGWAARVAGGLIDPINLIPILGEGTTGLRAAGTIALNALASAGLQEGVLYADQRTRTKEQVAFSLAASTVLGGVLGAASHTLGKSVVDRIAFDMANPPKEFAISPPVPAVGDAGAKDAATLTDAGSLKNGWGAKTLAYLSPVTRGFEQWNAPAYLKEMGGSAQVRKMTAGFSQAGLALEHNKDFIAASPGGNVEALKRQYAYISYQASRDLHSAYTDYILGDGAKGIFRDQVAVAKGSLRPDGKMTWGEFKAKVSEDIRNNFEAEDIPAQVRKAAKDLDTKVYKKLYDEAVARGIFSGKEKVLGDKNYLNRVYNHEAIAREKSRFTDTLSQHYQDELNKEFNDKLVSLQEAQAKDAQAISDAKLPLEHAMNLRNDLLNEQVDIGDAANPLVIKGVDTLRENTKAIKALNEELANIKKLKIDGADIAGFTKRQDRIGEIEAQLKMKALENEGVRKGLGDELTKYQKGAAEIRRRLQNLGRNGNIQDVKMRKKLDKIVQNEDAQAETIIRAQKQLQKFLKMLDSASPEKLDAELAKLKDAFEVHAKKFDNLSSELHAMENGTDIDPSKLGTVSKDSGLPPEMRLGDQIDAVAEKMDSVSAKIESLDAHNPVAFKQEIESMMTDLADTHAKINARRVLRNEKLWKQVENLSPEARAKRIADLELKAKERPKKFIDRWNTKNAGKMQLNDKGILEGNGDFKAHADQLAQDTVDKILGADRRLAFSDIIKDKRGPELARLLNIPTDKIKDFVENDAERLAAIYTRTVGSDLAIAQVFKTPDAAEEFTKLTEEANNRIKAIDGLTDKKGNPLPEEQKMKLRQQTEHFYAEAKKDLYVLLERARGMRGVPKDPSSWAARGAKLAMDWNFLRLMGTVLISSVADPGRIIMKQGLTRTFRDGLLPMISAWREIRLSQREAKLAGAALDPVLHSRAYSLTDIFDDAHRGTAIEKATHWASTKMGLIAGFDHWTSAIKQITAGVVNARLLDSISLVMGEKGSAKEIAKAQEFLAKHNIDADFAERIWKEVTNGEGGGKVNGVWLPNTENWTDESAKRAYRAALGQEIDDTIITPGFERPSWVDSSIPARLLAQFKSYGLTSTQKTVMAGLQEHDLATVNGIMSSLALGALSYYLYAKATGGKTETEMMNAGVDKWADEAISRSGITGIFDEFQRMATRVPMLQNYASFSGRTTTRRGGGDLSGEILGPSFDLMSRALKIGTEIDEPTKGTLHTVRTMMWLQNVFYIRQLLDKVEEAAGSGLPEKRRSK